MTTLDKKYFDKFEAKYPLAMSKFKAWIDGYKKEVNWDKLFNGI